jgi:hypothetical protein
MARAQRSASLKATLCGTLSKFVAILHLVNGVAILKAVGPGSANDVDERSQAHQFVGDLSAAHPASEVQSTTNCLPVKINRRFSRDAPGLFDVNALIGIIDSEQRNGDWDRMISSRHVLSSLHASARSPHSTKMMSGIY